MCGIVGVVGDPRGFLPERIEAASEAMRHRGPDDVGLAVGDSIRLGFRRLAIIDLSAAGHQPMCSEDGRLSLVFNGEIYNFAELRRQLEPGYRFRSRTDFELLLHGFLEWGWPGLLRRIDGMYAFALWDASTRTLYAARDRVGKKPFFYAAPPGGLVFGSTLNALLALASSTPAVDPVALDAYLTYQAVPAPLTIFSGVRQLPPAHELTYHQPTESLELRRYWDLAFAPKGNRSEADVLDDLDALVRQAVRKRLASDVPLGAFLSGGVDSGLVVALLAQESSTATEAVVLGFDDPAFDERPYARAVARRWGIRLHEATLRPDALTGLPEIIWHYGQPLADVSIVPTFAVARAARQFVTVVLNGDGGDEAFGGYARPVAQRAATLYRRWLPAPVRAGVLRALEGHDQGPLRRAWLLAATGQSPPVRGFTYDRALRSHRSSAHTQTFARALGGWHPDALYADAWARAIATDNVDRALYGDFSTYLPDQLLAKMDVSTMAHSLEARSPLLDVALLEYAATIPTELRLRRYRTKYLLKRLAARYLPPSVIYRRKRGFVMPAAHWLSGELRQVADGLLRSRAFRERDWVRTDFVERMLVEHQTGRRNWGEQIWTLLVLEIWARLVLDRTLRRSDRLTAEVSLASGVA
jgi:asparagine synthase (glutamine-hydrolysing)